MNQSEIALPDISLVANMVAKEVSIFYKPVMSKKEVAKFLGKSIKTIETWVREDEIPYRKKKSTVYFFREEIMDWMDSCA